MELLVKVRERHALPMLPAQFAVCGSSKDHVRFDLDAEWNAFAQRTARFRYFRGGKPVCTDVTFFGNRCKIPVLRQTDCVEIGLFAGNIHTSAPARFPCLACITDLPAATAPDRTDIYNTLMEMLRKGGGILD